MTRDLIKENRVLAKCLGNLLFAVCFAGFLLLCNESDTLFLESKIAGAVLIALGSLGIAVMNRRR